MATSVDPIQEAFAQAVHDFKTSLDNDKLYQDILTTVSIDDVYDATDKLQAEQGKTGRLRHLSKIQPYLERLREYSETIGIFVQVKPEILALVWGPIRLLLQLSSVLIQSWEAIITVTGEIGDLLPEFKLITTIFSQNTAIKHLAVLFFRDILEFYVIALKFFGLSRWRYIFEAVWPKRRDKIKIVISHIEHHTSLMRQEFRIEQIRGEHEAQQQALKHFELTEKMKKEQEFHKLLTNLNPAHYDRELDRINSQTCAGTGQWLLVHESFSKWLDTSDGSSYLLWLTGIPGAGKTFLAGTAIEECLNRHQTSFAFLSHIHMATTTALSVICSLIFQVAAEDEDLQSIVCQSAATTKLRMDFKSATELLKDLVTCVGPNYIVIDGLDEINRQEQTRLLESLVKLSEVCQETRVLIASRAENDLTRILDSKVSVIRADAENSKSIGTFVTDRVQKWLQSRNFLAECKQEIETLLAPLASKADGMFLYVQIILNCIEPLNEIDEIRSELQILPDNLEEAYGRIFRRINSHKSRIARAKCRNLLGWVCCSPTPMTLRELEQALLVPLSPQGPCRVSSTLDVVELCGPIVEVVDEFVYMVHFTVKEYITSPAIENFINTIEAGLGLAICSIRYLCQSHHDPDLDSSSIRINIKAGDYRLHYYASTMWLDLLVNYLQQAKSENIPFELVEALNTLIRTRYNSSFSPGDVLNAMWHSSLQKLESTSQELFRFLKHASQFARKCDSLCFQFSDKQAWLAYDTTTLHITSNLLRKEMEEMLCLGSHSKSCDCSILRRHYGDRKFKCDFFSCLGQRLGFESRAVRKSHHARHSRSWKCDEPSCHYSKLGFLSKKIRDVHQLSHQEEAAAEMCPLQPDTKIDELETLFFKIVHSNDTKNAKELLPELKAKRVRSNLHRMSEELILFVNQFGSEEMILLTASIMGREPLIKAMELAIESTNISRLEWLLEEDIRCSKRHALEELSRLANTMVSAIQSESIEIREVYAQGFYNFYSAQNEHACMRTLNLCLTTRVLAATSCDSDREETLLSICDVLNSNLRSIRASKQHKSILAKALKNIALSTCSIRLAKAILEYGVDVDFRQGKHIATPLHIACRKSSAEAAELAKFLLYAGANANLHYDHRGVVHQMSEEVGAQSISNWLGIEWEKLVQRVAQDRENGIDYPGSFPTMSQTGG